MMMQEEGGLHVKEDGDVPGGCVVLRTPKDNARWWEVDGIRREMKMLQEGTQC